MACRGPLLNGYVFTDANNSSNGYIDVLPDDEEITGIVFDDQLANSSAPYRIDGNVCLNGRTRNSGCTQTGGITMTLVHKDSSGNQIGDEVTTATLDDENNLGWYQFTGLAANDSQAGDYYTVIPYKLGFGFTPSQEDVVITDSSIPDLDFEGTELKYTISGVVSSNSVPLEGVVVSLHTLLNGVTNTLTNGDGEYMFGGLYNGFYTLTTDGEGCYPMYGSMSVRIHYESEEVNLECEGGGLESALAEKQSVMSRLNALRAVDRRTKEADNKGMETQAVKSNPSAVRSKASAQSSSRTETTTATYYFYHWDHLGTTRLITNSSGNTVSRHDYEPFGVEIPTINDTAKNTHQFTGHERDKTTGYDYMHFRYYGSNIGRFMKPDNVTGSPLNPQNWNLYSYVRGNPVNMNDPTGHEATAMVRECYSTSSSGWISDGTNQIAQTERQQQENKEAPQSKADETPPEGAEPTVEHKLTAEIFAEMRGYTCKDVPDAIASVIVNNAKKKAGDTLSDKIGKEINNSRKYQGETKPAYFAALKGEEGLKELRKDGKIASSDLTSYQNARESAKAALAGTLADTTEGAMHFYSKEPGGKDPSWVDLSLPQKSISCDYRKSYWVFTRDN